MKKASAAAKKYAKSACDCPCDLCKDNAISGFLTGYEDSLKDRTSGPPFVHTIYTDGYKAGYKYWIHPRKAKDDTKGKSKKVSK